MIDPFARNPDEESQAHRRVRRRGRCGARTRRAIGRADLRRRARRAERRLRACQRTL